MELHDMLSMTNSEHQRLCMVLRETIEVLDTLEGYFDEDERDWIELAQVYCLRILRKAEQRIEVG